KILVYYIPMCKVEFAAGLIVRLVLHCNANARDSRFILGSLGAGAQASTWHVQRVQFVAGNPPPCGRTERAAGKPAALAPPVKLMPTRRRPCAADRARRNRGSPPP